MKHVKLFEQFVNEAKFLRKQGATETISGPGFSNIKATFNQDDDNFMELVSDNGENIILTRSMYNRFDSARRRQRVGQDIKTAMKSNLPNVDDVTMSLGDETVTFKTKNAEIEMNHEMAGDLIRFGI